MRRIAAPALGSKGVRPAIETRYPERLFARNSGVGQMQDSRFLTDYGASGFEGISIAPALDSAAAEIIVALSLAWSSLLPPKSLKRIIV